MYQQKLDQAELPFGTLPFPSGDGKGWLPGWGTVRCHLWLWQRGVERACGSCYPAFVCSGKNLQESKVSSGSGAGRYSPQGYSVWLICLRLPLRGQYDNAMDVNVNKIAGPVCWGVTSREKRYLCHYRRIWWENSWSILCTTTLKKDMLTLGGREKKRVAKVNG